MRIRFITCQFLFSLFAAFSLHAQPAGWEQLQPLDPMLNNRAPLRGTEYAWDSAGSKWTAKCNMVYAADKFGYIGQEIKLQADTKDSLSWSVSEHTKQGHLTLKNDYEYNPSNGHWIYRSGYRAGYAYNTDGLVDTVTKEHFDFMYRAWKYDTKTYYSYNADNTTAEVLSQKWNNGQWKNDSRTLYTYGDSINEITNQSWDGSAWQTAGTYVQDVKSKDLIVTTIKWVDSAWHTYREIYHFDDRGNYSGFDTDVWDSTGWRNIAYTRIDYTYSDDYLIAREETSWSAPDAVVSKDIRTTYVYAGDAIYFVVSWDWGDADIELYPNPVKDVLHVKGITDVAFVSIYDLQGNEIFNEWVESNKDVCDFDLASLRPGMYVIQVNFRKKTFIKL